MENIKLHNKDFLGYILSELNYYGFASRISKAVNVHLSNYSRSAIEDTLSVFAKSFFHIPVRELIRRTFWDINQSYNHHYQRKFK